MRKTALSIITSAIFCFYGEAFAQSDGQWASILPPFQTSSLAVLEANPNINQPVFYGSPATVLVTSPTVYTKNGQTFGANPYPVSLSEFATQDEFTAQMGTLNSQVNTAIAGINANLSQLKKEAWTGTALAASLTPILPTDGNQNHINLAGATANGVQAVSLNYAHVEGPYDFIAGAAVAKNYSLAKIGVGFSW